MTHSLYKNMKGKGHAAWRELKLSQVLWDDPQAREEALLGKDVPERYVEWQSSEGDVNLSEHPHVRMSTEPSWSMLEAATKAYLRTLNDHEFSGQFFRAPLVNVARHLRATVHHEVPVRQPRGKALAKKKKKEAPLAPFHEMTVRGGLHFLFAFLRHAQRVDGERGAELLLDLLEGLSAILLDLAPLALYHQPPSAFEAQCLTDVVTVLENAVQPDCSEAMWQGGVGFLCALCRLLGSLHSLFLLVRFVRHKGPQRPIPSALLHGFLSACRTLYRERFREVHRDSARDAPPSVLDALLEETVTGSGRGESTLLGEELASVLVAYASEMAALTMVVPPSVEGEAARAPLDADVLVMAFSDNNYGETPSQGGDMLQLPPDTDVRSLHAGSNCTFLLTDEGRLLGVGKGDYGRLGHGSTNNSSTWTPLAFGVDNPPLQRVAVSGGSYGHGLAITEDGELWSWGDGDYGKLGHGNTDRCESPVRIAALTEHQFAHVSCGYAHSLALTTDGKVFGWGGSASGSPISDNPTPTELTALEGENITQVVAGAYHSVALGQGGQVVYGWGRNGEPLGLGGAEVTTPTLLEGFCNLNLTQVACGGAFTMALSASGQVYFCGNTECSDSVNYPTPAPLQGLEEETIVYIAAGGSCGLAISAAGQTFIVGAEYGSTCYREATLWESMAQRYPDGFELRQAALSAESWLLYNIPTVASRSTRGPMPLARHPFSVDPQCFDELVASMQRFLERLEALSPQDETLFRELEGFVPLVRANFYHGLQMGAHLSDERINFVRQFLFALLDHKGLKPAITSVCKAIFEESWDTLFTSLAAQVEVVTKLLPGVSVPFAEDHTIPSGNDTEVFILSVSADALTKDNQLAQLYGLPCEIKADAKPEDLPDMSEEHTEQLACLVKQLLLFHGQAVKQLASLRVTSTTTSLSLEDQGDSVPPTPEEESWTRIQKATARLLEYFVTRLLAAAALIPSSVSLNQLLVRVSKDVLASAAHLVPYYSPACADEDDPTLPGREHELLDCLLPYLLAALHFVDVGVVETLYEPIKALWSDMKAALRGDKPQVVCEKFFPSLLAQRFAVVLGQTPASSDVLDDLRKNTLFAKGFSLPFVPTSAFTWDLLQGKACDSEAFRCVEAYAKAKLLLPSDEEYPPLRRLVAAHVAVACRAMGVEKKLERLNRRGARAMVPLLEQIITEAYIVRDLLLTSTNDTLSRRFPDLAHEEEEEHEKRLALLSELPMGDVAHFLYRHLPAPGESDEVHFLHQLPTPTLRASIANIGQGSPLSRLHRGALHASTPFESQGSVKRSPKARAQQGQEAMPSPKTAVDQAALRLQQMQPVAAEEGEDKARCTRLLKALRALLMDTTGKQLDKLESACKTQASLSAPICSSLQTLTALLRELPAPSILHTVLLDSAFGYTLPRYGTNQWGAHILHEEVIHAVRELLALLTQRFEQALGADSPIHLYSLMRCISDLHYRSGVCPPVAYTRALCRAYRHLLLQDPGTPSLRWHTPFWLLLGSMPADGDEGLLQDVCDELQDLLRWLLAGHRPCGWLVDALYVNAVRPPVLALLGQPSWVDTLMEGLSTYFVPDLLAVVACLRLALPTVSDETDAWKSMHAITTRLLEFIQHPALEWRTLAPIRLQGAFREETEEVVVCGGPVTFPVTFPAEREEPLTMDWVPVDDDPEGDTFGTIWASVQLQRGDEPPKREPLRVCYYWNWNDMVLDIEPFEGQTEAGLSYSEDLFLRLLGLTERSELPWGETCQLTISQVQVSTEPDPGYGQSPAVCAVQSVVDLLQTLHATHWKTFIDSRITNALARPQEDSVSPSAVACLRLMGGLYSGLLPGGVGRTSAGLVTLQECLEDGLWECLVDDEDHPRCEDLRPFPVPPKDTPWPVSADILEYLLRHLALPSGDTLTSWPEGLSAIASLKCLTRYCGQGPQVRGMVLALFQAQPDLEAGFLALAHTPSRLRKHWTAEQLEHTLFAALTHWLQAYPLLSPRDLEKEAPELDSEQQFLKPTAEEQPSLSMEDILLRIAGTEVTASSYKDDKPPETTALPSDLAALRAEIDDLSQPPRHILGLIQLLQREYMAVLARQCFMELLVRGAWTLATPANLTLALEALHSTLLQSSVRSQFTQPAALAQLVTSLLEANEGAAALLRAHTSQAMHLALVSRLTQDMATEINLAVMTSWLDALQATLPDAQGTALAAEMVEFYAALMSGCAFPAWDRAMGARQLALRLNQASGDDSALMQLLSGPLCQHLVQTLGALVEKQFVPESRSRQGVYSLLLRSMAVVYTLVKTSPVLCALIENDHERLDGFITTVMATRSFQERRPVPLSLAQLAIKDFVPPAEGEPLPTYLDNERWTPARDDKLLEWNRTRPHDWKDPHMVWIWGDGTEGQLASSGNRNTPTLSKEFSTLEPKQIAGGIYFTLVLSHDGSVWATGKGEYGRLGVGDSNGRREFTKVQFPGDAHIAKITSSRGSYGSSMALDVDGRLYVWGDGDYGKLGLGHTSQSPSPQELVALRGEEIVSMSCGYMHTGVVTREGQVYLWGEGQRLGMDRYENSDRPLLLEQLEGTHAEQISCGEYHTLVIANSGREVWAWGHENENGQLGLGHTQREGTPKQVSFEQTHRFVKAEAANSFSVLLTSKGKVLTCGRGDQGALGQMDVQDCHVFREVEGLPPIADIAAGTNFCLALTEDGRVFAWGANDYGELGTNDSAATYIPVELPALVGLGVPITHIAVGHSSSYCLAELVDASKLLPESIPSEYEEALAPLHDDAMIGRLRVLSTYSQLVFRSQPLLSFTPETLPTFGIESQVWRLKYEAKISCLRQYIQNTMPSSDHGPEIRLNRFISEHRQSLFLQACDQLIKEPASALFPARAWRVTLLGEGSIDAGGPYNESVTQIAGEIQRGRVAIVQPTPNRLFHTGEYQDGVMPLPLDQDAPSTVQQQYRFLGRLMGIAVRSSAPMSIEFPLLFWKLLMGARTGPQDLRSVDEAFVERHEYLLRLDSMGITEELFDDLPLDKFLPVPSSDGRGPLLALSFANRQAYVQAAFQQALSQWDGAIECIGRGMDEMVPRSLMRLFSAQEVNTLVTGEATFQWERLKEQTSYQDYSASSPPVQWLWEILEEMSNAEASMFLRFVWGRSRLPLLSTQFTQTFNVRKVGASDNDLPTSATCFFRLYLPEYSSKDIMQAKLLYAIEHCVSIDTDNQAQPVEMAMDDQPPADQEPDDESSGDEEQEGENHGEDDGMSLWGVGEAWEAWDA